MSQAVIFLARGGDGGLEAAEAFFESYRAHAAGLAHDLIVIAKGWEGQPGREALNRQVEALSGTVIDLPDDGFDWGAYMRVAPRLPHDWVCFFNTHSRICADGWLAALRAAAELPDVGAAGATGSWGTHMPTMRQCLALVGDLVYRRGWARGAVLAGLLLFRYPWVLCRNVSKMPVFPNAHLRSNAFLMRRQLFCDFIARRRFPKTKRDCHILEAGRLGLSRFLLRQGLGLMVVGRDRQAYSSSAWDESGIFWVPDQPNLLVEDNQTRGYIVAPWQPKRVMEMGAWGRWFTAVPPLPPTSSI